VHEGSGNPLPQRQGRAGASIILDTDLETAETKKDRGKSKRTADRQIPSLERLKSGLLQAQAHVAKAHMAADSRAAAMMALGAVERKIWNI
jgi:hypothetical protein